MIEDSIRVTTMRSILVAMIMLLAPPASIPAQPAGMPAVGDRAPAFSLPGATKDTFMEQPVDLTSLLPSGPVVVAFYPADWSTGCTREMCTFRDRFADLGALGVTVVGISGDYVYSHREWAGHLNLPFALLSDHDHAVASAYGSYNPATGYNLRTVFVVGSDGIIMYVDPAFKAGAEESFAALSAALKGIAR